METPSTENNPYPQRSVRGRYQNDNYKSMKSKKTKGDCGCDHKTPKKMNNLVDLQWFKILGSNKKGSK